MDTSAGTLPWEQSRINDFFWEPEQIATFLGVFPLSKVKQKKQHFGLELRRNEFLYWEISLGRWSRAQL